MEKFDTPEEELPDWAKQKPSTDPPSEIKSDLYGAVKKTVFILGIALLVFASARNSLTWHCERFWGASKDVWSNIWTHIHEDLFRNNDFLLATMGINIFLTVHFWLNSLFFFYLDIFQPQAFKKYKVQDNTELNTHQVWKTIRVCLRNQFLTLIVSVPLYFLSTMRGQQFTSQDLPTFHYVLCELCVFIIVEEVGFYYAHRLLHHRSLYKHIHKIHHEWTAPISIVGIYCHPVEHIISNVLPLYMGPFVMGSHIATSTLWMCIAISSTQVSHGGYHLPFFPSPEAHDFHHLKFTNNFGVMGVLDRLHGTDASFVKTKAYDRHIMLIGLASAKERFPEEEKLKIAGVKTKAC